MSEFSWNAADYDRHSSAQRLWAAELLDRLALTATERVLDIGCGDGKITAEMARRVPAGLVVGLDLSAAMVAHARSEYAPAEFVNLRFALADARALPFCDAFEVVFSNAVLHWVRDHQAVLRGIRRSLRQGGRLLLQMGGRGNAAEILDVVQAVFESTAWRDYFREPVSAYSFYSPDDYEGWLAEAGLRPLRIELIPKDMTHQGQSGLEGWIRTTWMPYTQRVPPEGRDRFIADVASRYLEQHPADGGGVVHVQMVRLEVEAVKD